MLPPPANYRFLRSAVLPTTAICGPTAGLFVLAPLGAEAAIWIGSILGCIGFVLALYMKYRSKFGVTQTWIGSFIMLTAFCGALGGGALASSVIILSGETKLVPLTLAIYVLTMLAVTATSFVRETRALAKPDSWASRHLDLKRFVVRRHAPGDTRASSGGYAILLMLLPIALNIPLFIELGGGNRYFVLYVAVPALTFPIAKWMFDQVAPAIARALYARRLERAAGRQFVHEEYEAIQQLRRTFWLSRWLMRDYAAPRVAARGARSSAP